LLASSEHWGCLAHWCSFFSGAGGKQAKNRTPCCRSKHITQWRRRQSTGQLRTTAVPYQTRAHGQKRTGALRPTSGVAHTSGFNWESPSHLAYPASTLAPSPPLPVQELDGSQQHFPPGSTEAPVEMGGTPLVTTPPPPQAGQYQPYQPPEQQYPGQDWSQPQR